MKLVHRVAVALVLAAMGFAFAGLMEIAALLFALSTFIELVGSVLVGKSRNT